MKVLVTGSAGHLGEALVRVARDAGHVPMGVDRKTSAFTHETGSITDRAFIKACMRGMDAVVHAASLHKPHIATHSRQDFVDINVTGTLNLLEEAAAAGVGTFIFTSTTSVFGRALTPPPDAPASWITEDVVPLPGNVYGITKLTAESLCELFHRQVGLASVVLRTSRFFPEPDDRANVRRTYDDGNVKANEFLYRRADIQDVANAHVLALEKAPAVGFARYIVSATTPFAEADTRELRVNTPEVVSRRAPGYEAVYARRNWSMFPTIDRVYANAGAREALGWVPIYDFARIVRLLDAGDDPRSPLAKAIGSKGYHDDAFTEEPYPVA
jgi:UDP-glucose 4-epimerase